ncbi:MAG: glutathione S-transferase family protein [Rhodospirillales bacterium]|nr:glutathione S-transferase family protein [Rhodospirillales bacterium]
MSFILRSAGASPFARKVRIAAHVVGLIDDIELEGGPSGDDDPIYQQNPLGKIPVLITEDGKAVYDSPVILEYLDTITLPGSLIPHGIDARFEALRLQALGDGILDAAILIVYEGRYRPEQEPYEPWLEFQRGKIERALGALAAQPPALSPVTVGNITIACALGYLDFRKQVDWRAKYPALIPWLDDFAAACPGYDETRPDA